MSKKSLYQKFSQRNQSLFIARGGGPEDLSIERGDHIVFNGNGR